MKYTSFAFHEFALTFNMIEQLVHIFGVLSGGKALSSG